MPIPISYSSIPLGSLVLQSDEVQDQYLDQLEHLPKSIVNTLSSAKTGAYIRGITKEYQLPQEVAPQIAFSVLRIMFGQKTLAELPATLSSELGIANDKAQKIANEIEKDLLAPISLELNQYLESKKQGTQHRSDVKPMSNVLNLKDMKKPPRPPLLS